MLKARFCFVVLLLATVSAFSQPQTQQTAKDFFDSGVRLLQEKRYAEALIAFQNSARLAPSQPAAHASMGSALVALRRFDEAAAAFRAAIRLAPYEGSFHSALCQAFGLARKHAESIAACREGIRLAPNAQHSYIALIEAARLARNQETAIRQLIDSALQKFPDSEHVIDRAAEYYTSVGDRNYTAELYERLTRLKPNSAYYHARLADAYLALERDSEALTEARRALELEPSNPWAQFFMGKLFLDLGQIEEASAAFEKVIANEKAAANRYAVPDARLNLAYAYERRGRIAAAISIMREAVALNPDAFSYQLKLGSLLNADAQYEEAVAPLRKAAALEPDNINAQVELGLALFESAQFDKAIPLLEEVNRKEPENRIASMFLNVARSRQQNIPKIDDMKRYAKENPADLKVRVQLIQALAYSRRIGEADFYLQEALELKPADVQIFQRMAVSYSTAGKQEQALEIYKKSLEFKESPDAYLGLAGIYRKWGRAEEASKAFAKVIELKPETPNTMGMYGDLLLDIGKRREALEMYKRSLAILPLNGPVLFNAAVVSARLGDLDAARRYLETLRTADQRLAKTLERCLRLKIWQ